MFNLIKRLFYTMNKPDIIINRSYYPDCTLGRVSLPEHDFNFFSLELPWKHNATDISCIPEGKYLARKHLSPSNGSVFELMNVPRRSFIQIHVGNFTEDIEGCIVVGNSIRYLDQDTVPDVTNSKNTFDRLYELLPETVVVHIKHSSKEYNYD